MEMKNQKIEELIKEVGLMEWKKTKREIKQYLILEFEILYPSRNILEQIELFAKDIIQFCSNLVEMSDNTDFEKLVAKLDQLESVGPYKYALFTVSSALLDFLGEWRKKEVKKLHKQLNDLMK
ncbi:hypothetical protein ACVR1G_08235 [Streptococcus dentasini]